MRLASYTATRPGLQGLFNRAVRWWLHGPYSHTELVFSDGMCASCSWMDKGVRLKAIEIHADKWDVLSLPPHIDEAATRARVEASIQAGEQTKFRYSLLLLATFVVPPLRRFLAERDQVCSTYIAWALCLPSWQQHDPMELADLVRASNR